MFHNQRNRLLRTEAWDANALAQELWAMFGPDVPLEHRGPITLFQDEGKPAITFKNYGGEDAVFSFQKAGEEDVEIPRDDVEQPSQVIVSGAASFPGQVVSGTGNTYTVNIYRSGLGGGFVTVTVRQLYILETETIPAGTWTMVSQLGSSFYMNVPTWG